MGVDHQPRRDGPRRTPYATAAIVLVLLDIIACPFLCIPGIFLARWGRRDARANGLRGEGLATVAEVAGWIELVLVLVLIAHYGIFRSA